MTLNDMAIFHAIATQQSISKAAIELDVSKSWVSKSLTKLEAVLNTKLILRNSRKLTLTKAGEIFLESCRRVVAEAQLTQTKMENLDQQNKGHLKISLPTAFTLSLLTPLITEFAQQYPDVILDFRLESELIDVMAGGYDLVIRSAKLDSSNLIVQKIYQGKNILCATPKYLKKQGILKRPQDLLERHLAGYHQTKTLSFTKDAKKIDVVFKKVIQSNNLSLIKELALNDVCLAYLPSFMIKVELEKGELVTCLADYQLPSLPMYVLYPEKKLMSPALKNFLQMLKAYVKKVG